MSKILICGFPHCGTSILKSIIGHINEVDEIIDEVCNKFNKKTNKKYILGKCPYTYNKFFTDEYKDYIKIFIIRNPLYVFSSLNKRFKYKIPNNHNINSYIKTLKMFINMKNNHIKNIYTLRYEDLFKNNYQSLKYILDNIGLKYDDNIFNNKLYNNKIISSIKLVEKKPLNTQHGLYRTWQINQPFISNNDISKIDLFENQKNKILNNLDILKIYPNIKKTITKKKN